MPHSPQVVFRRVFEVFLKDGKVAPEDQGGVKTQLRTMFLDDGTSVVVQSLGNGVLKYSVFNKNGNLQKERMNSACGETVKEIDIYWDKGESKVSLIYKVGKSADGKDSVDMAYQEFRMRSKATAAIEAREEALKLMPPAIKSAHNFGSAMGGPAA